MPPPAGTATVMLGPADTTSVGVETNELASDAMEVAMVTDVHKLAPEKLG
jgi:hypothetical protein